MRFNQEEVNNMMWYENIPVNINNNGDPLIDNQIESTVMKVKSLTGYANIFHICTNLYQSCTK